jgi:DNA modification methylase
MSEKKYGKHPTQKPLKILNELIKTLTNPNDLVLDPFMGSGSTCVAAALNDRRYVGIELNTEYHSIATLRINNINELTK